jgi:hypothetical protein
MRYHPSWYHPTAACVLDLLALIQGSVSWWNLRGLLGPHPPPFPGCRLLSCDDRRHAARVPPRGRNPSGAPGELAEASATLRFAVQQSAEPSVPEEGILASRPSLRKRQRNEQKKSQRPRDWRTRKDPEDRLLGAGHRLTHDQPGTNWSLHLSLAARALSRTPAPDSVPDRYLVGSKKSDGARLLTFEEQWTQEELGGVLPAPLLRGEVVTTPS